MLVSIIIIIVLIIDVSVIGEIAKLILIPMFIFSLANIINDNSCISELGKHSTNIWLIHAFFYDYLFSQLVYAPKYSILVFIWLILLCLASSYIVNIIYKCILKNIK